VSTCQVVSVRTRPTSLESRQCRAEGPRVEQAETIGSSKSLEVCVFLFVCMFACVVFGCVCFGCVSCFLSLIHCVLCGRDCVCVCAVSPLCVRPRLCVCVCVFWRAWCTCELCGVCARRMHPQKEKLKRHSTFSRTKPRSVEPYETSPTVHTRLNIPS
jgi:hypothetical protein